MRKRVKANRVKVSNSGSRKKFWIFNFVLMAFLIVLICCIVMIFNNSSTDKGISGNVAVGQCVDTDGGVIPNVFGYVEGLYTVTGNMTSRMDICCSDSIAGCTDQPNSIREYFCSENFVANRVMACSEGRVCVSGACRLPTENPNQGLVAYYHFNGDANDASGNGNNGQMIGNVNCNVPGVFGSKACTNFRDNDKGSIYLGDNSHSVGNFGSDDFSISFWINVTTGMSMGYILDKGVNQQERNSLGSCANLNTPLVKGYALFVNKSGTLGFLMNSGPYPSSPSSPSGPGSKSSLNNLDYTGSIADITLTSHKWHHVVYVFDRTSNKVTIYLDGKSGSVVNISLFEGINLDNNVALRVGNVRAWVGTNFPICATNFYSLVYGSVDELKLYNRTLTQSEINELATVVSPPPVSTCTDSDVDATHPDGKNYDLFGIAHGKDGFGVLADYSDGCKLGVNNVQIERYCDSQGIVQYVEHSCSAGQTCVGGVCSTCGECNPVPNFNACVDSTHYHACINSEDDGAKPACYVWGDVLNCEEGTTCESSSGECVVSQGTSPGGTCDPYVSGSNIRIASKTKVTKADNKKYYCDPLTLTYRPILALGANCDASYQCDSNNCADGKCISTAATISLITRIWCFITNPLSNNGYEQCVASGG